ncbi:potassium channel family protein [Paramuribaculum intestinale]|uniref:potassium channel family protein n=1 Tax=Paramuribaculum intestinale TaxID=2094151 RepID=UPI000FFEFEB7|nr:TrkA family potassium uptake protein [Paramuribaculum intestinale]RXE61244.1 TrkA family potassium uptake protein [Muribaculaceae bacterium Isolate-004 (NCI)]
MRYLIIGLGIYGANLAIDLTNMGHEVIGADKNPSLVESIKDFISTAYIIDATDEMSLSVLPLKNVDLVIVAIGENFGASIRTVALLKKLEVKHIFARAIDKLHEAILEGFHIDRILTPEQRAASDLVNEMGLGAEIESMRIDDEHYVLKFPAPDFFTGSRYDALDLRKTYGMDLVAVSRLKESRNLLGVNSRTLQRIFPEEDPEMEVEKGDELVCIGTADSYRKLFAHVRL